MRAMVSWQDAEDALVEAVELLGALPDRERGWLAPGHGRKCSSWPAIVRQVNAGDYGDGHGLGAERPVRRRVGVAEMAFLDRMLLGEAPLANAIPMQHRALVGRVVARKRWSAGGFAWDDVRSEMAAGRDGAFKLDSAGERLPSGDALRMRYERAIAKLAGAMSRAGWERAA